MTEVQHPTPMTEVPTLERPLYLLTFFTSRQPSWTLSALARRSELPKASCLRSIRVLEKYHFLRRDGDIYRLGTRFIELGAFVQDTAPARKTALPYLQTLSQHTGLTVSWAVLQAEEGFYAEVVHPAESGRLPITPGQPLPLAQSASSYILTAFAPQDLRQQVFAAARRNSSASVTDLESLDGLARKTWLAMSVEGDIQVNIEFAAPIFQANGKVVAALGLHDQGVSDLGAARLRDHLTNLNRAAEAISRDLGYMHDWQGDIKFFLQMLRGLRLLP